MTDPTAITCYYLLLPVITCYYLLLPVITCYCLLYLHLPAISYVGCFQATFPNIKTLIYFSIDNTLIYSKIE